MNKMSLAIVSSSATAPGAVKLRDAAKELGHQASIAVIGTDDIVAVLRSADKAIFRVGPKTHATYLDMLPRVPVEHRDLLNGVLRAFDKAETSLVLNKQKIPSPDTYVLKQDEAPRSYPVVVKIPRGNQGLGVELVHSVDEYSQFWATHNNQEQCIAQEYIVEANKQDKRLLIVGNQCIAAMRRRSSGDDFRANLHMGGVAEPYTPTEEEVMLAVRASKAFDLPFAGIDIIDSNRGPLVLEINPSPGLAIGDVTGVDVATRIIKEVMKNG